MGLGWSTKLAEHKVVRHARTWATGAHPGHDECEACGKKLKRHRTMLGSGRVCSPQCAMFVVEHWK